MLPQRTLTTRQIVAIRLSDLVVVVMQPASGPEPITVVLEEQHKRLTTLLSPLGEVQVGLVEHVAGEVAEAEPMLQLHFNMPQSNSKKIQ